MVEVKAFLGKDEDIWQSVGHVYLTDYSVISHKDSLGETQFKSIPLDSVSSLAHERSLSVWSLIFSGMLMILGLMLSAYSIPNLPPAVGPFVALIGFTVAILAVLLQDKQYTIRAFDGQQIEVPDTGEATDLLRLVKQQLNERQHNAEDE